MPLQTSADSPVPVRTALRLVGDWVGRLGRIWVEGQIAELTKRGNTAFLTLRDPVAAVSVRVICARTVLDAADPAGDQVRCDTTDEDKRHCQLRQHAQDRGYAGQRHTDRDQPGQPGKAAGPAPP